MKVIIFKKLKNSVLLILLFFVFFIPIYPSLAQTTTTQDTPQPNTSYHLLVPLPTDSQPTTDIPVGEKDTNSLGVYLNLMIKIIIGLCAVLAMVMIVMGGIEYMTTELISSKEAGKERIRNAIVGLLLALGAYTLLYTINPDLLNTKVKISLATIEVTIKDEPEPGIQGNTLTLHNQSTGTDIALKACDESQMVTTNVFGTSVEIYKGLVDSLQRINTAWLAMGNNKYPVTSIGGYNCRSVTNKPGYYSAHAYGLAIDINPDANPYTTNKAQGKTNMPGDFVQLFTSEGWAWGGSWSNVYDPMHFSTIEGGDNTVQVH